MIADMSTYVFLFYAALDIVMAVLVYFFVKETKGRTLEEMEQIFHSKVRTPKRSSHASFRHSLTLVQAAFDNEAARKKAMESGSEERISDVYVLAKDAVDSR